MRKGQQQTEDAKKRISETLKISYASGKRLSWNKGLTKKTDARIRISWSKGLTKKTDSRLTQISEKLMGNTNGFKKGHTPWCKGLTAETDVRVKRGAENQKGRVGAMKGRKHSEETKRKISLALLDNPQFFSDMRRKHLSEIHLGEKNPMYDKTPWNKGLTKKTHPSLKTASEKKRKQRLKQIIPKKDTSIEVALQRELDKRKIAYEKHVPVCGICQPDIVFSSEKVAVFADGNYWHSKTFDGGKVWRRDRHQDDVLQENDWTSIRFWGSEIRSSVSECVEQVVSVLEKS